MWKQQLRIQMQYQEKYVVVSLQYQIAKPNTCVADQAESEHQNYSAENYAINIL